MSEDKKRKLDVQALREDIRHLFVRLGIDEATAQQQAATLVEDLQRRFGGQKCYVRAPDKTARNAQIAADLAAGLTPAEVARKHGIGLSTVKRIRAATSPRRVRGKDGGFGSSDWNL